MKRIRTSIDVLRQRAYELAASPESTASEREAAALCLHRCSGKLADSRAQYEREAASACFARRAELREAEEELNPLDDEEKLRQVRIAVFGSAPES
jgi:hypothetical protein